MVRGCLVAGVLAAFFCCILAAQHLVFLKPYRALIWHSYLSWIGIWCALLAANVAALLYMVLGGLSMRTTGRKLEHMDRGLRSGGSVMTELSERLEHE